MKFLIRWVIPTFLLAAILHLFSIWFFPVIASSVGAGLIRKSGGVEWNEFYHFSLPTADSGEIMASPDIIYSFASYDVAKGTVRLHCVIPDTDNYWSVSLYDWNAANFFVENDLTAPTHEFVLIITESSARYQPRGNERVVVSPTAKGMVFIRSVVSDRDNKEELALITAAQKKSTIEPLVP